MTDIRIERRHNLTPEELQALAKRMAEKLQQKLGGACQQQDGRLDYQGNGVSAKVLLEPQQVKVTVQLGLLMSAFAGSIEREINQTLDKHLTAD